MTPSPQTLEIWGDFACFTQPTFGKVERFSYPVITPSAARGIFDAIYHKPKFRWQVTRIEILSNPRYIALMRNEVQDVISETDTLRWATGQSEVKPLMAGAGSEKGTPRQTMALKQVHYRLQAEIRPWADFRLELPAMEAQFRRRARHGQCFYQPYLGCREFPAYFRLIEEEETSSMPISLSLQLGWMLYDVFDLGRPGTKFDAPSISLFNAVVREGVLVVPDYNSSAVHKTVGES